jgi:lysozyme family protein
VVLQRLHHLPFRVKAKSALLKFLEIFDRIIGHEAGYVNNPQDPGGETKWGISKRSYPHLDIKNLTREQARDIYYNDFWLKIQGDAMPDALAFQCMDFAINSGIETAIRYLQRAVGVADDGHIGPVTLSKLGATDKNDVIMKLNAERLDYMTKLSNWPNASKGWARRIAQNLRYGSQDN